MYNWRLLLLAFFAVFQPIASFTERNLVDGREQCCDHRLERDSAYSLYGNSRFKHPSEDRRLVGQRREIREDRRNDNAGIARLAIDSLRDFKGRENLRSLELGFRSSRTEPQRERESHAQIRHGIVSEDRDRVTREVLRNTRTDRIRVAASRRDILSRDSRAHQINRESSLRLTRDAAENVKRLGIEKRSISSRRVARYMQAFNDDIQGNSDSRETRFELRRTRSSTLQFDRPTAQYDRRIEHDDSLERRVRKDSQFERNQRNVRSSDRLSRSNEDRFSLERVRISDDERNARAQPQANFRNDIERRSIEMRLRERVELDRNMNSRSISALQRLDNNRDHRSVSRSIRRENEFRVSTNGGERAYEVEELRYNVRDVLGYRRERRDARERNDYERHSTALIRSNNDNNRQRSNEYSLSADRRSSIQIQDIREQTQEKQSRDDVRTTRIEKRRSRDVTTQRMAQPGSRLTEKNREHRVLDSRDREIGESKRTTSDRIQGKSKEIARDVSQDRRSQIRDKDVMHQWRDETRELRERTERFRERSTSEHRPARVNQQMEAIRNSHSEVDESKRGTRQFTEKATDESNRLSLRMNVRDIEQRPARDNRRMEATRNFRPGADERQKDARQFKEKVTAESNSLSLRMNFRDIQQRLDRENQRMEATRNSRSETNERQRDARQFREKATAESNRLSLRMNARHIEQRPARDNRRMEATRNSRLETDGRQRDTRQFREEATDESNRLSLRMNARDIEQRPARNNRRMEATRNFRSGADERQSDTRQFKEKATAESNSISLRMNSRDIQQRPARENQRMEATRNSRSEADERHRDMRQFREKATAESNRLLLRINARDIARNNERSESHRSDPARDDSRDHISSLRVESRGRSDTETARNRVVVATRFTHKTAETENQNSAFNWQYLIITLQGIYLCSIFMPMLAKNDNKKTKNIGWWAPFQSVIKTD